MDIPTAAERRGSTAIVVGCGLGADAEHVASLGFDTVGFDISPTAIRLARQRHPASSVRYVAADVLDPPAAWLRAFDFVVEIITGEALPDPRRRQAITNVGQLVAPGGSCAGAHSFAVTDGDLVVVRRQTTKRGDR